MSRTHLFFNYAVSALTLLALLVLGGENVSAAEGRPAVAVRKGKLPENADYWKYYDWSRTNTVTSVIVNGTDREALLSTLAKIRILQDRNVLMGRVIIVGSELVSEVEHGGRLEVTPREKQAGAGPLKKSAVRSTVRPTELGVLSRQIGLRAGRPIDASAILEQTGIRYSPAWIIRYRGKDYVFEGNVDVRKLFAGDGSFVPPAEAAAAPAAQPGTSALTSAGAPFLSEDEPAPIAARVIKPSGLRMLTPLKLSAEQESALRRIPGATLETLQGFAVEYDLGSATLPTGAGTFDGKPRCEKSEVRRTPVLADASALKNFDILAYDFSDPEQTNRASHYEFPTAPYLEGDLFNPYREADPQQDFIRLFEIRCLPTRFHYVETNGSRSLEYREGESAWE